MVPPLTEGQRATLTCRAPGRCSGSDPEITWKWTGRGNEDSHLIGNITGVTTDEMTGGTFTHASTLMFEATASQHLSNVTCKVSFKNNISTEETVTLTINASPKILNTSGCGIQSDILTCICISQGVPLPTISWPLLKNHTEYFIITTVSDSTVNSTISLSVTDYNHTVRCVSNNGVGRVQHNLKVLRTSTRENGAVQCSDSDSVLPWSVAAVALIIGVVSVICILRLWKAGQKTRAKNENSTYMSLQKTHPTEYDVIHQL
ncbi:uncharacterized protein [Takifugu rubripes]|uniref:uncharacterized protein n=1 Tax=Takifugu rubripes TaxID=31033 RepID=UPI001145F646|nr:uncharacterized protein LOC115250420 [Takifugu rubripes]